MTTAAVEPLVFKIVVDDSGVDPASVRTSGALGRLGEKANAGGKQFTELRRSTALTRQEMLALNYTVSDVAASLASGASPFTILMQQGGQVRDSFGGIGPAISKISSLITIGRVAVGALAGAVVSFSVAAYQGAAQSRQFERDLQLTGNRAGMTASTFKMAAESIASDSKVSIGLARDVLTAAVRTGQFGPGAIVEVGRAAASLAKVTGRSADDVVKDFASMSAGVARWAAEHNRSYAYLTAEQFKHIRALEAQGRAEEAMRVNAVALDKALRDRAPELGALQSLWEGVKNKASAAWDAMLNIGRTATSDQVLARLRSQLQEQLELQKFENDRGATAAQVAGRQAVIDKINAQIDSERELAKFRGQSATASARNAAANAKEIEEESKSSVDRRLELERSFFARSQAQQDLARQREEIADKRALDLGEITSSAYTDRRIARETAALEAKEALINEEIALERRRVVENPADGIALQSKLIELETKRVAVSAERLRLQDRIARGELFTSGPAAMETAQQQFVKFERERQAELEKGIQDRKNGQAEAINELLQVNRSASISLIQDDRARGLAQIALEEELIRKRLDLASMSAGDRRLAEEGLANWRVLRERQLTEELKPEYQRQLELFQDLNRYMRKASDDFRTGWLDTGREAFTTWVRGGEGATKRLTDFIRDRFAAMVYDKYLAGLFDMLGKSIFSAFTGFGGGGGGGGGGDWFGDFLGSIGIGALAGGGTARRNSVNEVNERGPELLTVRGRDFLMMGADSGTVTPAGQWQRGGDVIDNSTRIGSVGAGVSYPQLMSVLQQFGQRQEGRIRRLIEHGRL